MPAAQLAGGALLCGVIGGALEGVAARTGHRRIAVVLLVTAGFFGILMPFFALGRWFDDQDYVMESANLFQPVVAWLLFVAAITAVALPMSARGRAARDGVATSEHR